MKNYIGTELIKAIPAWKLENETIIPKDTVFDPNLTPLKVEDGYMVTYEDDCTSWRPKDVFEKAYRIAETTLDRMYVEYNDLLDKYNKLTIFLGREDKEKVAGEFQCELMELQRAHMKGYLLVLRSRIELMKK